jgi:hypothetical protein
MSRSKMVIIKRLKFGSNKVTAVIDIIIIIITIIIIIIIINSVDFSLQANYTD